jgi:hypothetical protein
MATSLKTSVTLDYNSGSVIAQAGRRLLLMRRTSVEQDDKATTPSMLHTTFLAPKHRPLQTGFIL